MNVPSAVPKARRLIHPKMKLRARETVSKLSEPRHPELSSDVTKSTKEGIHNASDR